MEQYWAALLFEQNAALVTGVDRSYSVLLPFATRPAGTIGFQTISIALRIEHCDAVVRVFDGQQNYPARQT